MADRRGDVMGALVLQAAVLAAKAHRGQMRKGASAAPYIEHPLQVSELVSQVSNDDEVLAAAVLHDVLEDSDTTHAALAAAFGERVAGIVVELTDDPSWKSLPVAERKARQAGHFATASDSARIIKMADQTCNLRDLAAEPGIWPATRHNDYRRGAESIVQACRPASAPLAHLFDQAAQIHRVATDAS